MSVQSGSVAPATMYLHNLRGPDNRSRDTPDLGMIENSRRHFDDLDDESTPFRIRDVPTRRHFVPHETNPAGDIKGRLIRNSAIPAKKRAIMNKTIPSADDIMILL